MPLAFYDNTLITPFPISQESKNRYIDEMLELIRLSAETEVPLIGYIARSLSRDVLSFLDIFDFENSRSELVYDSDILFPQILQNWGDRTCFFYAKRKGLKNIFGDLVGFIYLQTTGSDQPSRIDVPSWVFEKGYLPEIVNVVRAECIIGLGYPYCLETADQTAVITNRDKELFYRALEDFADRQGLNFSISRKAVSKKRRR